MRFSAYPEQEEKIVRNCLHPINLSWLVPVWSKKWSQLNIAPASCRKTVLSPFLYLATFIFLLPIAFPGIRFSVCNQKSEDPGKNHQYCNYCQDNWKHFLVSLALSEVRRICFLFPIYSGVIFFLECFIPRDCAFLVNLRIRIHRVLLSFSDHFCALNQELINIIRCLEESNTTRSFS